MRKTRQQELFPEEYGNTTSIKPVNVASVPQRSPFRYPGGKTWFVPVFRDWISTRYPKPNLLVEPFAGGGIISLTAIFENLVQESVMVEIDEDIAAVWQSVADGNAQWLANRILEFDLTKENLINEISKDTDDLKERAFQTILKNRTFHGGILAEGSGILKYGENGKGVRSRWYPGTLARRFNELALVANRIIFLQADGLDIIPKYSGRKDTVFFIDPPYTAGGKRAGKRLYRHFELDHDRLFSICESIRGDFLMTYDNADEVKAMARRHGFQMRLIPMNNTHHATMEELVIGKELSWMDEYPMARDPRMKYDARSIKKTCKNRRKPVAVAKKVRKQ
ncbi:MAG TPA: DNA adenine methylase [Candidatus Hydrogenedentes bacterium]|nr:DNA adenine methylase [Candidatus Hydrogenedentota bacterium]